MSVLVRGARVVAAADDHVADVFVAGPARPGRTRPGHAGSRPHHLFPDDLFPDDTVDDDAGFDVARYVLGRADVTQVPLGGPGVEHRWALLHDGAVLGGHLSPRTHHRQVDDGLYEGRVVTGAARTVVARGEVVVQDDRYVGRTGHGRFLHRGPSGRG